MNRIIVGALSLLLSLSCFAQSKLPPCRAGTGYAEAGIGGCYGVKEQSFVKYVGEFFSGMPDGQGSETFSDGSNYVGEFKNGQRNGRGTYTFPNGDRYVGEFKGGNQHGQGIRYDANGKIIASGYFENDKLLRSANATPDQLVKVPSNSSQTTLLDSARVRELATAMMYGESGVLDSARVRELEEREAKAREQERLRTAELEAERKRREELEEKLRIVQQQANPPAISSAIGKRVALVIGNSSYKTSPLDNPANDAKDVAVALRGSGFETQELLNATKQQMLEATRAFERKVVNSDVALIYSAGHGTEVKGKNYMIPVGANIEREYELSEQAYDAAQWLDMLEGAKGTNTKRVNIVILDACRNNALTRGWRSSNAGLARMDAPVGTFLAYSTAPGKVASDGNGRERNSPFAKHLVNAIKQPNMPIEQVFKRVRSAVIDETKGDQIPWDSSSLVGDFFFTVKK
jgi:hypothetical protein